VTGTKLTVVGPANLQLNGAGTYTVTATDSSSAGIANATVALTSALGNTLSAASIVTGTNGQNTVTLTATKAGSDTLTAKTLGVTAGISIAVSPQVFQFTSPVTTPTTPSKINLHGSATGPTSQALTVNWQISGAPQVGKTITFATTRGAFGAAGSNPCSSQNASNPTTVTAVTDASGNATAPAPLCSTIAGPAIVTASATGVSAQANIDFIATVPSAVALQASPATVPTQGQSTINAIVRDANNNLVEGATVNFTISHDTTSGSLSLASAVTDAQGSAQSVYTAGATTSASNGVIIQAAVVGGTSPTATANLTVGGLTVFLSLGTGNKIRENATFTQFIIDYTVQALDAGGNPVANVPITLTIHPLHYYKGGYVVSGTSWVQTGTPTSGAVVATTACPNEDNTSPVASALFNGVLDPGEDGCDGGGHDNDTGVLVAAPYACNSFGNGNHKLDPGGTAIATPSSVTTSAQGSANFTIVYPEDQALWVEVELIATATVSGTETTATSTFVLPILATYLTTTSSSPPGDPSPYGIATSCTNPN
jgi:hypothetical protein